MVSNQTVVSRGVLSFEEMISLNDYILDEIKKQNTDAIFDDIYISPFHPNATIDAYRKDSDCRKPRAGMLLEAQRKFNIDFKKSFLIGDRLTDIYAGKSVGSKAILLLTGSEHEPLIESNLILNQEWLKPDFKFNNLYEAALFIKEQQ
jgi:D-glycero-D-manno-heptose 1,7-bisphosphate phosphatase